MFPRRRRCLIPVLGVLALFTLFYLNSKPIESFYDFEESFNDETINLTMLPNFTRKVRRNYEDRGRCPQIYGNVTVFLGYTDNLRENLYKVALQSLQCYLKGTDYNMIMVDLDKDERVQKACGHHELIYFKKHCAAAEYLKEADWMLVLDADTGVINPHHCIEEWIDPRVNLIFYERFFNWEIAAGNYLVRKSRYSYYFLKRWANSEFRIPKSFNGYDNGALHLHILKSVILDAVQEAKNCAYYWKIAKDYGEYMAFVSCIRIALGAKRLWPGTLRIYRRAHGWVRDDNPTNNDWGPSDFMMHGWKEGSMGENPFERDFNISECGEGDRGWPWVAKKRIGDGGVRQLLSDYEKTVARRFPRKGRVLPYLKLPDVRMCYPNCEEKTDRL